MDQNQLYTLVLGLVPPWMVDNVVFKVEEKRLDLQVTFPKGSRFYLEARQLLFATPGKDASSFARFATDLGAQVTFDRFHLMKRVNEAVDQVRRSEALTQPDLKKTRWVWLKNDRNLKAKLQESLQNQNLKTEMAYQYRLAFQDIYTIKNRHQGAPLLKAWLESAKPSGLTPIVKVAYTILNYWDSALRWFESQINNGIFEGFNSLIQSAKAKARGYRTHKNFISMAYRSWVNWILGYPLKMSRNQLSPSIKE